MYVWIIKNLYLLYATLTKHNCPFLYHPRLPLIGALAPLKKTLGKKGGLIRQSGHGGTNMGYPGLTFSGRFFSL